jgi:hypothetical protein
MSTLFIILEILAGLCGLVALLYYSTTALSRGAESIRDRLSDDSKAKIQKTTASIVVIPLLFVSVVWLAAICAPHIFPESEWAYVGRYSTSAKYVMIEKEPHTCEWSKAPLGNKYCHFDKVVTVDGDASIKMAWPVGVLIEHNSPRVYVTWEKIEE